MKRINLNKYFYLTKEDFPHDILTDSLEIRKSLKKIWGCEEVPFGFESHLPLGREIIQKIAFGTQGTFLQNNVYNEMISFKRS